MDQARWTRRLSNSHRALLLRTINAGTVYGLRRPRILKLWHYTHIFVELNTVLNQLFVGLDAPQKTEKQC